MLASLTISLGFHQSCGFGFFLEFLPVRSGKFDALQEAAIGDASKARHWTEDLGLHQHVLVAVV